MSRNIGWSKRIATDFAKKNCNEYVDAYAQREEHWPVAGYQKPSYAWIVVLQKKPKDRKGEGV